MTIITIPVRKRRIIAITVLAGLLLVSSGALLLKTFYRPRMATNCFPPGLSDCFNLAEAEEVYHKHDWTGSGILKYTSSIQELNTKLRKLEVDYQSFADAEAGIGFQRPRRGYVYRILSAQGPNALSGRRSYIDENGHMTRGYAIVAFPYEYNKTGILTFMTNNNGTIYQKDLGSDTRTLAEAIAEFDPDSTWEPVQ